MSNNTDDTSRDGRATISLSTFLNGMDDGDHVRVTYMHTATGEIHSIEGWVQDADSSEWTTLDVPISGTIARVYNGEEVSGLSHGSVVKHTAKTSETMGIFEYAEN